MRIRLSHSNVVKKMWGWGFANMLTFASMQHPYLVCILFGNAIPTFFYIFNVFIFLCIYIPAFVHRHAGTALAFITAVLVWHTSKKLVMHHRVMQFQILYFEMHFDTRVLARLFQRALYPLRALMCPLGLPQNKQFALWLHLKTNIFLTATWTTWT